MRVVALSSSAMTGSAYLGGCPLELVMTKPQKEDDDGSERSPEETERIAARTLKNLLNTPPKPFTKKAKGKGDKK